LLIDDYTLYYSLQTFEQLKISITIEGLDSEGIEIKYQLLLVLYNGNERMDTEKIDLFIIP